MKEFKPEQRKRRMNHAGGEYISTPVHIKWGFSSKVPQRLHSIRFWCNFYLWCYEMMQKVLHPPTALAAEHPGVKLICHSPLIHVASGSCAWSFPLKMSSIVTFFLEARLSSSPVSRRFGQYYKNRLEKRSLSRQTA